MTAEPLRMWLKVLTEGRTYEDCLNMFMRRIATVSTEYERLVTQARGTTGLAADVGEAVEQVGYIYERLERLRRRYKDRTGLQTHEYKEMLHNMLPQRLKELVLRERYDTRISYDDYRDVVLNMSACLGPPPREGC
eukprot:GHVO01064256.1.p1 GENE.GHVO01064256.1~~GHVO01064256.1.p1  ORF type:complete len:136 (+),score=9.07 GHVO01064256.1:161-568(+)